MPTATVQRLDAPGNRILQGLPTGECDRLLATMEVVKLPTKTVIFEPGAPIEVVLFPISGVISLVTPLLDGSIVEVATIGNEGVVGVPHVMGESVTVRAISQVVGESLRMPAGAFIAEWERPGALRDLVQDYISALFAQISQAAGCNRLHTNEERLSRWLLMSHDRVGVDEFDITHEFLGEMLGSRRATVTLSAGVLQAAGFIRYHRGRVTIVDREGLEGVACECYRVIKAAHDRVVDRATARGDR
jgi:CRP-like cAMP-binding protein